MTVSYTTNFRFGIPDFNTAPWHADFDALVRQMDRVLYQVATAAFTTVWANSTVFTVGKVVIDSVTGLMWIAQVAHTSAATPTTFAQDRAAHPTFWLLFAISTAGQVSFTPAGNIVATNVQAAIEEINGDIGNRVIAPATNVNAQVPTWDGNDSKTLSGTGYDVGTTANDLVQLDGSARLPAVNGSLLTNITVPIPGNVFGLVFSNDAGDLTNDIGITSGIATESTNAIAITLPSALIKRLDAGWAAGTNQGMRNSAVAIANGTYHIYLVAKAAGANPDIYAHTSPSVATVLTALQAESGGASYIYARRIFSILREAGAIVIMTQTGSRFIRNGAPIVDVNATTAGTAAVTRTLSVPDGIVVEPIISVTLDDSTGAAGEQVYLSSLYQTDIAVTGNNCQVTTFVAGAASQAAGNVVSIFTNTSRQIRSRQQVGSAATTLRIKTSGWMDTRGILG